jgi:hypothetical protein
MKRRGTSRRSTIHLIAEDKTGEFVFKELMRKKNSNAHVRAYGKAVGVSTLAQEIEALILIALHEKSGNDCIVVLHDTDVSVQTYRKDYETINRVCEHFTEQVTRLQAVQEIEAWLLADDAFCHWLGETPKASDHIPKPSERLERLINKKFGRRLWTNLNKPKILEQHMDATGDQPGRSESMRIAMEVLGELSCTQLRAEKR